MLVAASMDYVLSRTRSGAIAVPVKTHGGEMDIKIVVLQRGWIAVGSFFSVGDERILQGASIIRRWGTSKGLGEIAAGGPNPKTVLDSCPDLRFHVLTTVLMIDCTEDKWASHCKPR